MIPIEHLLHGHFSNTTFTREFSCSSHARTVYTRLDLVRSKVVFKKRTCMALFYFNRMAGLSIIYAFDLHSTLKPIEMAERFKLKTSRAVSLSRVIPSLQICRPKGPSDSVYTPVPAIHRLSPVDSKAFDISFPVT